MNSQLIFQNQLLQPIVVLVTWTCLMWVWMYWTRTPAMLADKRLELDTAIGFTGRQLDELLPRRIQWKAHNYNHLHEQPTIFYATVFALALAGQGTAINTFLAWGFVVTRVVHSLYHSLINRAKVRFYIFCVATAFQFALAFEAMRAVFLSWGRLVQRWLSHLVHMPIAETAEEWMEKLQASGIVWWALSMARDGTSSRLALLKAGLQLAEKGGLAALSVNEVVRRAGLAKGTFYVHFSTRDEFLAALHEQFHSDLEAAIGQAIATPGQPEELLFRGVNAYLDGCLKSSGVKALLQDVRGEPSIARQVRKRDRAFADRLAVGLRALGWPLAEESALLFVAMIAGTAIAELEAGKRLPTLRSALFAILNCRPMIVGQDAA